MEEAATSSPAAKILELKRHQWRDWLEIIVAYALILAVEWTSRPWQRFMWLLAASTIAVMMWRSFDGRKAIGLHTANFRRSLWIVGAALILAGAAIVVAIKLHTLGLPPGGALGFIETYIAYAIWTGVQQLLLQGYFLLRFLRVLPNERLAALTAAALFASAHLPNPILTPATFIWGLAACLLFLAYRNLYPLMIAHAILGITVALTVPGPVVHNMRVGLGYFTYHPHRHTHQMRNSSQP
jgi:membrane protease YdiL (CAAX protease family)